MYGRSYWSDWARNLQRWGLKEPAAVLLEAAGPFKVFLAQAVYFSQPFVRGFLPPDQCQDLAQLLEDRDESLSFIAFLREEG